MLLPRNPLYDLLVCSQATDFIAGLRVDFVDSVDHIVQQTTAIRLLFRTVSSWHSLTARDGDSRQTQFNVREGGSA